jgi:hypothetical protein
MRAAAVTAAAALAMTAGCAEDPGPRCDLGPAQPLALDAPSPAGGTLAELLAVAAGQRTGPLRWQKPGAAAPNVSVSPQAGTTTSFEIEVTSTATAGTFRPGRAHDLESATTCTGRLAIDATAQVATGDGGLAETWTVSLQGAPGGDTASFVVDMRAQPVAGTLSVTDPDAASWDKTFLLFDASLSRDGSGSGGVSYGASRTRGNLVEGYSAGVASWTVRAPAL